MRCSIINSNVRVLLRDGDTDISLHLDENTENGMGSEGAGGGLQSPDVRRAELAAVLRRTLGRRESPKSQNAYWSAFMADYVSRNANGNNAG